MLLITIFFIGSGYDLAALLRYRGFSADAEYGYDRFEQDREGGNTWYRFAYRFDVGYFLIPKKFEIVARYDYFYETGLFKSLADITDENHQL